MMMKKQLLVSAIALLAGSASAWAQNTEGLISNPTIVINGPITNNNTGLYVAPAVSGYATGATTVLVPGGYVQPQNFMQCTQDSIYAAAISGYPVTSQCLEIYDEVGPNSYGSRAGLDVDQLIDNNPGSPAGNNYFQAGSFNTLIEANMGGTAAQPFGEIGSLGVELTATPSANYLDSFFGEEITIVAQPGSAPGNKIGLYIGLGGGDGAAGTETDAGIGIDNEGSTVGWGYGINFGNSAWPIATTGTIMGSPMSGTSTNGIYFPYVNFTGNPIQMGKVFSVDHAGSVQLAKQTVNRTAPGAGQLRLEVVAGTKQGTCKLVAFAGSSTVATTIADDIGSGC
jgi:hypothetical protein